jgi:hypothetical protein
MGDDPLLLLSVRTSSRVLRVAAMARTKASCSQCMLAATAVAVACCSSTERLEVLSAIVIKMVVVRGGGG